MKKAFRYIILLGIIVFSLLFIFFFLTRFTIRKMIIISSEINFRGLNMFSAQSLLFINTEQMIKKLKDQNPNIAHIYMKKEFPSTLTLTVSVRKPMAIFTSGSTKVGIDKEGKFLFGMETNSDLPKMETASSLHNLTNNTDWRISKAIQILTLLDKESILVDRIILRDNENMFVIYLNEGSEILVPYNVDSPTFAASLQVIIRRFRIEGKFISKIDFRFEKPIVQLINEEKNSSFNN